MNIVGRSVFALGLLAGTALAGPFINGSFEQGVCGCGYAVIPNGDTFLTGWTVSSQGGADAVEVIGSYWDSADGNQNVQLQWYAGAFPAVSISQTFDTNPGSWYDVGFFQYGNFANGYLSTVSVIASAATFSQAFGALVDGQWHQQSFSFQASSATTTLTFTSNTRYNYGPSIDAVSVTEAVPEPDTWLLLPAALGLFGRRRYNEWKLSRHAKRRHSADPNRTGDSAARPASHR